MLPRPHALLIDFGGVLADAPPRPPAPPGLVHRLRTLTDDAVPVDQITRDLTDGDRAYARWRDEVGSGPNPVELTHTQLWDDFVTSRWPASARDAVRREATSLSYAWTWRSDWAVRPGIPEALDAANEAGLPLVVVSNTLCGAAHRDFLIAVGLAEFFAAQFYSDEAGLRKPNPELIRLAARAVDVPVEACWFVGDSVHRDIAGARRAGAGAAVLMRSPRTDREGPVGDPHPDVTVDDGYGLLALLR